MAAGMESWKTPYDAMLRRQETSRTRTVTCWNDQMESIEYRDVQQSEGECERADYPYRTYNEAAAAHNERMLGRVYAHDTLPLRNQKLNEQTEVLRDKRNVAVERIRLREHQHSVFEKALTALGAIYYVMVALVLIRLGYTLHDSGGPGGGGLLDVRNRGRAAGLVVGGLLFLALPFVTHHAIRGSYAWWTRDVPESRKTLGLRPELHPTVGGFGGVSDSHAGAGGEDYVEDDYIKAQRNIVRRRSS